MEVSPTRDGAVIFSHGFCNIDSSWWLCGDFLVGIGVSCKAGLRAAQRCRERCGRSLESSASSGRKSMRSPSYNTKEIFVFRRLNWGMVFVGCILEQGAAEHFCGAAKDRVQGRAKRLTCRNY